MTAALAILPGGRRPEGRPSNASLSLEVRTLRHALETVSDERDELAVELRAHIAERRRFAADVLALARRGQVALAAGYRPAHQLRDIECLAVRHQAGAHDGGSDAA